MAFVRIKEEIVWNVNTTSNAVNSILFLTYMIGTDVYRYTDLKILYFKLETSRFDQVCTYSLAYRSII